MWRRRTEEDGFTLIELMGALSLLAVGFFSLAGAMGIGFKQVALARQRQSATEIANARLEHLRNLPYESAALSSPPVHNTDPQNPDYSVSADGTTYDIPGAPGPETLVVDTAQGQLIHIEDPVIVGTTEMSVYQYVTWRDDPDVSGTQDYKRVTVVVSFKLPAVSGISRSVTASAFVTTGEVIVTGSGTAPTQGSPSPAASPSPSASPSGSCSGDLTAPAGDFSILSGSGSETGYTASTSVTLKIEVSDGCAPVTGRFSNNNTSYGSDISLTTVLETVSWTVGSGDGTKSIWGRFKDGVGNQKTTGPYEIVLDATRPATPGTLTHSKSCSGNNRTVNLSWGSSTDTNFRGYRVYRSIDSAAWTPVITVSTTSASDTHLKTYDSVRFYVVGYDKAGNESIASNTIQLNKNQC